MDKVFIKGLSIQTTIGFYQWEKEIKQTLIVDVVMGWDTAKAAENDELAKTLDYAEISEEIAPPLTKILNPKILSAKF